MTTLTDHTLITVSFKGRKGTMIDDVFVKEES